MFVVNKSINQSIKISQKFFDLLKNINDLNVFTIYDLEVKYNLSDSIIKYLLNHLFIIPNQNNEIFARGIHVFPKHLDVSRKKSLGDLLYTNSCYNVIIGLQVDTLKDTYLSTRTSPNEIRKSLNTFDNLKYVDMGNILYFPHYETIGALGERVNFITKILIDKHHFPVFLGGDHSLTYYTTNALLREVGELGIIHFDAHHDLYHDINSLNPLNHANVFYHLTQSSRIKSITQIGVRTPSSIYVHEKITTFNAAKNNINTICDAIQKLPKDIQYYISFDIDAVDPKFAPDVAAPIPGGLLPEQCFKILKLITEELSLTGMDMVEVCQGQKKMNKTSALAAELIQKVLQNKA
ncbi:MAG: arginase family protein [Alphaproteobacteria bacterium]|nr:arginase family protein [Alphaproteobacteria bacterium]